MDVFIKAKADNHDVARVHTGDPSIFGSTAEQMRRIREENIESTAIIIVGRVLTSTDFADSKLYSPDFSHGFRA